MTMRLLTDVACKWEAFCSRIRSVKQFLPYKYTVQCVIASRLSNSDLFQEWFANVQRRLKVQTMTMFFVSSRAVALKRTI